MTEQEELEAQIAYLCDGMVYPCSGKVGCFKYPGAAFDESAVCFHTYDILHSKYRPSKDPEAECPLRFKRFVVNGEIRYFEEPEKEDDT